MKNSPRDAVALILNLLHENFKPMSLTDTARDGLADTLGAVKVAAGLVLLAALSWEIIAGDHVHMSGTYLTIQFIVCLVFLCDFLPKDFARSKISITFALAFSNGGLAQLVRAHDS